jgi:methionine-rich copper-binding protein CopC
LNSPIKGKVKMRVAVSRYTRVFYCLFIPVTMWAHAVLIDSTLHNSDVVSARTLAVVLSFNSRVDQERSTLTLERPGAANTPVAVDKSPTHPSELSGQLSNLTSGSYKLQWQVLAVDGHITRGVISFSVK